MQHSSNFKLGHGWHRFSRIVDKNEPPRGKPRGIFKNGWQNSKEINRVYYDPAAVSIGDMEAALEKAKTYQDTAGVAEDK